MSKASVLIIVTRYDAGSYYTYQWAQQLHEDLAKMDHTCLLLDAGELCRSGSSLADAIDCVEYVVFYGHGFTDEWTALPPGSQGTGKTTALVASQTVSVLAGRKAYAGCCYSLAGLGAAYAAAFPAQTHPNVEYIGYNHQFAFETSSHEEFRGVVNDSVIAFVKGASRRTVVADLQRDWKNLRDAFAGGGRLQYRPNAFAASKHADDNGKRVGHQPP